MRCYFSLIFVLLSWQGCLCFTQKIQSDGDRDVSSRLDQKNIAKKTTFIDLNGDVLHLIFQNLEFSDLYNIVEVVPEFAYFAGRTLHRDREIYIRNSYDTDGGRVCFDSEGKGLEIINFEVAMNTFVYFGNFLYHLRFEDHKFRDNESETILQSVNEYASESLITFHLNSDKYNTLAQFTKPFSSVEDFTCEIFKKQTGSIKPIEELFPKLKRFTLSIGPNMDYTIFHIKLPYLEHLKIEVIDMQYGWMNAKIIDGILRENSHIKSVDLKGFPYDYIKSIANLLPNLQNLTLHQLYMFEPVHFENVKHFVLYGYDTKYLIDKLTFACLETLVVKGRLYEANEWMTFFGNHQNISTLEFEVYWFDDLDRIEGLHNLVDLTLNFVNSFKNVEIVSEIIGKHESLTRLTIGGRYKPYKEFVSNLQSQFDKEWNVTLTKDENTIIMEKRIEELEL